MPEFEMRMFNALDSSPKFDIYLATGKLVGHLTSRKMARVHGHLVKSDPGVWPIIWDLHGPQLACSNP